MLEREVAVMKGKAPQDRGLVVENQRTNTEHLEKLVPSRE